VGTVDGSDGDDDGGGGSLLLRRTPLYQLSKLYELV